MHGAGPYAGPNMLDTVLSTSGDYNYDTLLGAAVAFRVEDSFDGEAAQTLGTDVVWL